MKNWTIIANEIDGRTAKQCRERWCNHLDPSIIKGNWTEEEDALILQRQKEMGNKWSKISKMLLGRTETAVKSRWIALDRAAKLQRNKKRKRKLSKKKIKFSDYARRIMQIDHPIDVDHQRKKRKV